MTPTTNDITQGVVQNLRSIRDQISLEITSMTFEQERAYLDKLLSENPKASAQQGRSASGAVS
jgi:hypothetical protein